MGGVLYLYQGRNGEVIYFTPLTLSPGVFFINLELPTPLAKGAYRLEFLREKIVRAEARFSVQ